MKKCLYNFIPSFILTIWIVIFVFVFPLWVFEDWWFNIAITIIDKFFPEFPKVD